MKWYTLAALIDFDADQTVQQSSCGVHNKVFIRPITGKYKNIPTNEFVPKMVRIMELFASHGAAIHLDDTMKIWEQAEFVENLYEFEKDPPCGCAPNITDD